MYFCPRGPSHCSLDALCYSEYSLHNTIKCPIGCSAPSVELKELKKSQNIQVEEGLLVPMSPRLGRCQIISSSSVEN